MQPGSVFAGYQIERLLGRGGMGVVYLARHPRLPRQVALNPAGANKITSVGEQHSTTCPQFYGTYVSNGLRFCAQPNLAERRCYRGSAGAMREHQPEYSLCPFHYVLKRLTDSVTKDDCKNVPSASYDASFTLVSDKITYCMRR